MKPDWLLALEELEEYAKERGWPHYAEVGHGTLLRMLLAEARANQNEPLMPVKVDGSRFEARPSNRLEQMIAEGKCVHFVRGRKLRCFTHKVEEDCPHFPGPPNGDGPYGP